MTENIVLICFLCTFVNFASSVSLFKIRQTEGNVPTNSVWWY